MPNVKLNLTDKTHKIDATTQTYKIFTSLHPTYLIDFSKEEKLLVTYKTTDGNCATDELNLEISLAGATSHTGSVITRWRTNEVAESKIYWGIDPDNLDQSMTYNGEFSKTHILPFPISFVGSFHYFKAWSRTSGGQEVSTDVLGIYVIPGEIPVEEELYVFVADLKVFIPKNITTENLGNILSDFTVGPKDSGLSTFTATVEDITTISPQNIDQGNIGNMETNILIT